MKFYPSKLPVISLEKALYKYLKQNLLLFIMVTGIIFLTGCQSEPVNASDHVDVQTTDEQIQEIVDSMLIETVSASAIAEPTAAPVEIEQNIQERSVWYSPTVPAGYTQNSNLGSQFTPAAQAENASLTVSVLSNGQTAVDGAFSSQWVYAVVVPFATITDNISLDDILLAWQGYPVETFQGRPVMMTESTKLAFEMLWGKQASEQGVRIVDAEQLLDTAWAERPSWAIIPFEEVSPRWKVLQVNGLSPLDKNMDVASYPLKINFAINGDSDSLSALHSMVESGTALVPVTNRDASKMADVLLTGVTALVRHTALRMEEEGVTYPAQDIVEWMTNADVTHVSNEVPFDEACPPAKPLRLEARFCSDPSYIGLLQYAGVDVVELTGNHLLDWGEDPFIYTLDLYNENQIPYYGGGYTLEEGRQPLLMDIKGNKLALIGCNAMGPESDWATDELAGSASCDMDWMESEVQRLTAEGYQVIVTFQHFEVCEFSPQSTQKIDFERMAQAGAVIVSGSQAHCPQGMAFVNNHFIHYGLGNLFFDQMDQYSVREFLDLHVFYDGKYIGTQLLTAMLEDYSQPRPMTTDERELLLEEVFEGSGW